jgi:hypothetical protein
MLQPVDKDALLELKKRKKNFLRTLVESRSNLTTRQHVDKAHLADRKKKKEFLFFENRPRGEIAVV